MTGLKNAIFYKYLGRYPNTPKILKKTAPPHGAIRRKVVRTALRRRSKKRTPRLTGSPLASCLFFGLWSVLDLDRRQYALMHGDHEDRKERDGEDDDLTDGPAGVLINQDDDVGHDADQAREGQQDVDDESCHCFFHRLI